MVRFLLITFSVSIIFSVSGNLQAQEGGMEDVKVISPTNSVDSLNQEILRENGTPLQSDEAISTKSKEQRLEELKKRLELFKQLTPAEETNNDFPDDNKIKENKKDLSFNIFYYLIYKYKQVDVFGD